MRLQKIAMILALSVFAAPLSWADEVATSGRQFLLLSRCARETAMGGSFAAISDEATGVFCNPAAMVQLKESEMSLSHLSWIGRTNAESLAYVQPLEGLGTLGGGLSLYWTPAFDNTGGLEGSFSPLTYEGLVSYGRDLKKILGPNLSVGGSLKVSGSSFGSLEQSTDLSADLGFLYHADWKPLRLALVAENINLLTSAAIPPAFSLRAGASIQDGNGLVALEMVRVMGQNFRFQLGGEYWFKDVLALRAGLKTEDSAGSFVGLSFGVGLKVGDSYRLDYGASTMGDLGLVQMVSLGLLFGTPEKIATKPAVIPVAAASVVHSTESAPAYEKAKATLPKGSVPNLAPPYHKSFDVFQNALATAPQGSRKPPIPSAYSGIEGFRISVKTLENSVEMSWDPQESQGTPAVGYNVYVSMVPGAKFKKLNEKPVLETRWSAEVGLHGMTYYFRVMAVGPDGAETKRSELKDVLLR